MTVTGVDPTEHQDQVDSSDQDSEQQDPEVTTEPLLEHEEEEEVVKRRKHVPIKVEPESDDDLKIVEAKSEKPKRSPVKRKTSTQDHGTGKKKKEGRQ